MNVTEGLQGPNQGDAWSVHRHQYLRLLPIPSALGAGPSHQNHDLAIVVRGAGDPMFAAIDDIRIALFPNACPDVCRIAARDIWLGHGVTRADASLKQRLQPLLLLLLRAKASEHLHVPM